VLSAVAVDLGCEVAVDELTNDLTVRLVFGFEDRASHMWCP